MDREHFEITGLGGRMTLEGILPVRGAKNSVLKALAASIIFDDPLKIENVPDIEDVGRVCEMLEFAGATVTRKSAGASICVVPAQTWKSELNPTIAGKLRASVVLTGPLLARAGEVRFPFPGGCVLGERPIDLFLLGFQAMGCDIQEAGDQFIIRTARGLTGGYIFFPLVSVTATETLMLAAVLAEGETVLANAAMEPEIALLADFLNLCGAHIEGAGTPTIRIQGHAGALLTARGRAFLTPPDRIETGTFILLAALAGKDIRIEKCQPAHLGALLSVLARAGVNLETGSNHITVRGKPGYRNLSVRTHEYPGFPTDLQAPMAVFMTQAEGEATLLETIFDGRFRYADDLIRMGADITIMNPHRILVRGPRKLVRKELESPDLRAGLAYVMAASIAEGTSIINNAYVIDRGYEHI